MNQNTPIVIGGVGGSGTRLIAQILKELGYHLGNYLNLSEDNLWFTLLFKRLDILNVSKTEFLLLTNILAKAISSPKPLTNKEIKLVDQLADTVRTQHDKIVLGQMAESIKSNVNDKTKVNWGWKEPNSHVIVKQLKRCLPTMKYIHVIRNGIDMAFSENQNQLIFWGKHYFKKELENTPENSLKYWCRVHKELIVNTQSMKKDFYLLNFDEFCQDPKNGLDKLSQFFEMNLDSTKVKHLISLVKPPKTIGRYKQQDISVFNTEDLAYVKHLGFDTT